MHAISLERAVSGVHNVKALSYMRVFICTTMATALVSSAQAQLRVPVVPLPALPVQKLTQTIGQVGSGTLEQLSDVRQLFITTLIRANPHTIAADPRGNPIVRG